ncbi:MAG: porin [Planctomycetota bacterium]
MTRHARRIVLSLFAFSCITTSSAALAQSDDGDAKLDIIQQELDRLRQENESMRSEIDDLRLKTDDTWLTERRADEIRGIVQDVLADADTRSSLQGSGLTAGWSDHFFLASSDGAFKLVVDGKLQLRYLYNYRDDQPDQHRQGFENTRTQLTLRGHVVNRDWTYLVRGGFDRGTTPSSGTATPTGNGDFNLLDAWVRFYIDEYWSVRVGQYKAPFTREFLVDSAYLQGVERSVTDSTTSIGRTQGIELMYVDDANRWLVTFHDGAQDMLFGGSASLTGSNAPNTTALTRDSEFAITTRYERLIAGSWSQFVDLTSRPDEDFAALWGFAAHYRPFESEGEASFGRDETPWVAWTTDLSLEYGGAAVFASFTHHYVDTIIQDVNVFGALIQGSMYLSPKWEAFARFEYGWWDFDLNNFADLNLLTIGANYYIDGHDIKWSTDMGFGLATIDTNWATDITGFRSEVNNNAPQVVFRTQLQLLF